jgi:MOSC domain-containing protein YiiM
VLAIAVRTGPRAAMKEITEATAAKDGGLSGDLASKPDRGITFLAGRQWNAVMRELGADLPWHTRRANVLIDADALGHLIGRTIRIGDVTVLVRKETRPCDLMDTFQPGLQAALRPDGRAGVHGRVLSGGSFRVGDEVFVQT